MDDTTQSRASDAAAAASKKRRSSILKNQRSVRTPFSELEFNVTTPTDTAKSRRVSFSRRTGVAEFATNEATTTWKNFYEEHNKSLESSGNDSGNSSKQIGHIGKRLFDQQFEEVEADLIGSLNPGFNYNSTINNVNFGQITIVENTADIKLSNTQRNFELSNLTSTQTNVFGDDLTMPQIRENSQPIDINFSAINQIGGDDLDEIQKHLQNNQNVIHRGPFDRQQLSEYIEVDLNSTHVTVHNVESDMSITDTIQSPKVQEVSKSVSVEKIPSKDWVTDKENIAINPYITPKESTNFAVNEEPEKVLVFDGKRLTLQLDVPEAIVKCPEPKNVQPQRKTIVLNLHDDLPNFIDDPQSTTLGYISVTDLKPNTGFDSDMSITKPLAKSDQSQNQKTLVFDDEGDISFTQAIISNIVQDKRRTIVYEKETGNISITQSVPTNIIEKTDKTSTKTILYENKIGNLTITQSLPTEKRKTIVYVNEEANISMTQALPLNIIEQRTVLADDSGNLSITQAIPNVIIENSPEKKQTIIHDNEIGRLSKTQTKSSKLADSDTKIERRRTVVFENETGNISVTQMVPGNIILLPNLKQNTDITVTQSLPTNMAKRRTIVFDDADISMTQAVPNNILSDINKEEKLEKIVFYNDNADMSVIQAADRNMLPEFKINEPVEKRRTVFDNADVSITQAIDPKILSAFVIKNAEPSEKRQTVFDNADISITQAINAELLPALMTENAAPTEKKQTVFDDVDISLTQAVNSDMLSAFKGENAVPTVKRQTVFDNADISMTQAINADILPALNIENAARIEKRKTVFNNVDISLTQAVNSDMLSAFKGENAVPTVKRQTVFDNADISMTQAINADILAALNTENASPTEKRKTVFDDIDISLTQAVNSEILSAFKDENAVATVKRHTVFDNADISMTQAINADILPALNTENTIPTVKRHTVFDNADISMTQAINADILAALNTENAAPTEKRKTVFDDIAISLTQAVNSERPPAFNDENAVPTVKKHTVFDNADISIIQAINADILPALNTEIAAEKRQTAVNDVDIFNTQAVNSEMPPAFKDENAIPTVKRQTVFDNADISMTQAINSDITPALNTENAAPTEKRQTVFDDIDISNTQTRKSEILSAYKTQNAEPTEKRRTVFDNNDISMTQTINSELLSALNTKNSASTEKRQTVFDNADVSVAPAIDRDILPPFNKENAEPMPEEKQVSVFDSSVISMTQPSHNNQIIKHSRNDLNTSMINENINQRRSILKEDVNERRPISEDIDMNEVPHTKIIAFEEQILFIHDIPSSQPEMEDIDVSMNDISTKNIVESIPLTSKISNMQIKHKQPPNEIVVYQIASRGQIQKGKEKGDLISQPYVDPSSMDVDDEKLASSTKTSNDKNSEDLCLKTKDETENDDDQKLTGTSCSDEISTKSVSNDINSKSDINSNQKLVQSKSSSVLSTFSTDMGKGTISLCKEKDDAQSLTVSPPSHEISVKNLRVDSPKLTSRRPSPIVIKSDSKPELRPTAKESLLKELLDMSKSSFDVFEQPKPKVKLSISPSISTKTYDVESSDGQSLSNDILFFITKDDEEMKDDQKVISTISTDVSEDSSQKKVPFTLEDQKVTKKKQLQQKPNLSLEYKEENPMTEGLEQKLALLKTIYLDSQLPEKPKDARISYHHEEENAFLKDMNLSKCSKKFKLANDTKELLDMLSDLTEKESPQKCTLDPHLEEKEDEKPESPQKCTLDPHLEEKEDEKPESVVVKGHIENKHKNEEIEPRRKSFLPQRRSIVLSKEDILNNISMATATLQMSRSELEDESTDESTISESPEHGISQRRGVRMSDEIVKTLKFDDSISQTMNSDSNMKPLRKTAFGETTYMTDPKCKVIPNYLKDVSTDIKELMNDLVKPMQGTLPFEAAVPDKRIKKIASTCSIKLQANLLPSSQIDIHTELVSNPGSPINIKNHTSINVKDPVQRSYVSHALKNPIKSVTIASPESSKIMDVDPPRVHDMSAQKAVLIFDHNNPLNNVLLAPPAVGDVHKYNPVPIHNDDPKQYEDIPEESTSESSKSVRNSSHTDLSPELTQMNFSNLNSNYHNAMRLIKTESESKSPLIDQCVATCQGVDNKDINTVIAMKKTEELLETSSSLTLVDVPVGRGPFWSNLDDIDKARREKLDKESMHNESKPEKLIDSDKTSNESSERQISKKRVYSPAHKDQHQHSSLSNLELTPKPVSKIQRMSDTPSDFNQNSKDKGRKKKSPKKTGTTVLQQVTAEYDLHNRSSPIARTDSSPGTRSSSNSEFQCLEIGNSLTSTKYIREIRSDVTSIGLQDPVTEIPNFISDSELQTNIIAQLDLLPFMGSHECKWESSTSNLWSFLLLHSCLRLTVKLQQSPESAVRSYICAYTPVLDVQLDILNEDKKNLVAVLCVRLAAEAMRCLIFSGCRVANDVSRLLKRCARVARLAIRWARAMQDIKLRLAYSLTNDGLLSLKVANIPLRSVWDVSLKLDMARDSDDAPVPRASVLSVVPVFTDRQIQMDELKQVLKDVPMDWGHAPRSIWRVFKYLKYKRDYNGFGMEQ